MLHQNPRDFTPGSLLMLPLLLHCQHMHQKSWSAGWLAGKLLLIMQDNVNSQLERCKVEITLSSLPADSSRAQARRRGALLSAAMCWIDSLQACTVNALIAPE
jgi:hypothetical protein